ncbi:MAG: 5'-methylthioadenosine phosphorylase [Pseudomonadota bacterium]
MTRALILGSSHASPVAGAEHQLGSVPLQAIAVETRLGQVQLHRARDRDDAVVLFRHGWPHSFLPNQIPYRAQALALKQLGVRSVLCTSSVGVLRPRIPLFAPLLVQDLLMPDNRLPDGSACSVFDGEQADGGHLVVDDGLVHSALMLQLEDHARALGLVPMERVIFAYSPGPRTKTPAENAFWAQAGADVASMTLGPELVLLNELEIPTAALVVGHKYSYPHAPRTLETDALSLSLEQARRSLEALALRFLLDGESVDFANHIFRF